MNLPLFLFDTFPASGALWLCGPLRPQFHPRRGSRADL